MRWVSWERAVVPVAPVAGRSRWTQVLAIAIAVVSTALIVGFVMWRMQPAVPPVTVARFSLIPEGPFTSAVQQLVAISPDGNRIAYNAGGRLRVRSLGEAESRAITDADTIALNPAFSPDNTAIAFTSFSNAGLALRRIPAVGGTVTTVASFPSITNFSGISWSREGILMGVTGAGGGILKVSSGGGTPERIVAVDADQIAHGPQMLPDGRTVLFTLAKAVGDDRWDKAKIVAQSLADGTRHCCSRAVRMPGISRAATFSMPSVEPSSPFRSMRRRSPSRDLRYLPSSVCGGPSAARAVVPIWLFQRRAR